MGKRPSVTECFRSRSLGITISVYEQLLFITVLNVGVKNRSKGLESGSRCVFHSHDDSFLETFYEHISIFLASDARFVHIDNEIALLFRAPGYKLMRMVLNSIENAISGGKNTDKMSSKRRA